jgi:hypothetical protein
LVEGEAGQMSLLVTEGYREAEEDEYLPPEVSASVREEWTVFEIFG